MVEAEFKRVLVTGSRIWTEPDFVWKILDSVHRQYGRIIVVHGKCRNGPDKFASEWCAGKNLDVIEEAHPAQWDRYSGKSAGMIRNKKMVDLGAEVCLAFIRNDSVGASHCARLAEKAGIRTMRFTHYGIMQDIFFEGNAVKW